MRDLPPSLLEAFRSTLEDSIEAGILFHVVDITDPMIEDKIRVVDEILDSIGAKQERVLVFNKIDILERDGEQGVQNEEVYKKLAKENEYLLVSAHTGEGLEKMKELMLEKTKWM